MAFEELFERDHDRLGRGGGGEKNAHAFWGLSCLSSHPSRACLGKSIVFNMMQDYD
jgi:hypothetical protein